MGHPNSAAEEDPVGAGGKEIVRAAPRIGIVCDLAREAYKLRTDYAASVLRAGGVPLILPPPAGPVAAEAVAAAYLEAVDGLPSPGAATFPRRATGRLLPSQPECCAR